MGNANIGIEVTGVSATQSQTLSDTLRKFLAGQKVTFKLTTKFEEVQ